MPQLHGSARVPNVGLYKDDQGRMARRSCTTNTCAGGRDSIPGRDSGASRLQANSDFDVFNLDDVDAAFAPQRFATLRYQQNVQLAGGGCWRPGQPLLIVVLGCTYPPPR
jgi:hypothetical protein